MLDSSDQITFFQCSTVQSLYRCAHSNLLTTFSAESPGFSAATQLANPASDCRRRSVVIEIGNPTILVISLRGVELCCFKARSIYQSSHSLVFHLYSRCGLHPWKVSNRYVVSICWTAFGLQFIRDTIFRWKISALASPSIFPMSISVRCFLGCRSSWESAIVE